MKTEKSLTTMRRPEGRSPAASAQRPSPRKIWSLVLLILVLLAGLLELDLWTTGPRRFARLPPITMPVAPGRTISVTVRPLLDPAPEYIMYAMSDTASRQPRRLLVRIWMYDKVARRLLTQISLMLSIPLLAAFHTGGLLILLATVLVLQRRDRGR